MRGVLRDVLRPDSFLLAFRRALARDVARMVACRAALPTLIVTNAPPLIL
jgi:hypothetical protein